MLNMKKSAGFTLLEIMVVVVIIGILAAAIVPNIIGAADDARVIAAKADIANIGQALKLYRLDNSMYPSTEQGLGALSVKPTTAPQPNNYKNGGYLEKMPKDPWGRAYLYLQPGVKGEIDIYSLGADGQPGGTGYNADVGNWTP